MSLYDYIWKIMLRKIPYEKEGTATPQVTGIWPSPAAA